MVRLTPRTMMELPANYQEAGFLRVTGQRQFLWLNVFSLVCMAIAIPIFYGLLFVYHGLFEAPLVIEAFPKTISSIVGVSIVLLMIPVHEWFHGLSIQYWGHHARYGIKPLKGVVYATADGALFWRHQYISVALAPFVAISVLMMVSSWFFSANIGFWLMLTAVLNAAGAAGDFWMTQVALRYPSHALIRDEEDGMRVFMPTST